MKAGTGVDRREFLRTAAIAGAALVTAIPAADALGVERKNYSGKRAGIVDTNVSISRWPFRRLPLDETPLLVAKLLQQGVSHAWTGSFDGLFHKNLAAVNAQLSQECRQHGRGILIPFGSINPKLPDWQEDLHRCCDQHKMPGIRLHPNYHNYKLTDPAFAKLLALAAERKLIVQLAASMEDDRMQSALMRVPNVDLTPLPRLLEKHANLKIVLLNWFRSAKPELVTGLAKTGKVWFDIAMVEGVGGVGSLQEHIPADRIVFGSHSPFYYFESGFLKLRESALTPDQFAKITHQNAYAL
jgi:predicted TIM-barrel fold metal-dependent hydrolase